jgi:hypothetical protein
MRIQAAWRGWCGRAKAAQAFEELQQAVAERLQQDASALEIQRHWRMWRQQRRTAASVPQATSCVDTSFSTERVESSAMLHNSLGSMSPKVTGGRVSMLKHENSSAGGNISVTVDRGGKCENISEVDDQCNSARSDKLQDKEQHQLPEAALVCARVVQLRKMGVQLLWLQPEPDDVKSTKPAASETTRLTRKGVHQTQQLRPCRVAETVATAEHFFKRGYVVCPVAPVEKCFVMQKSSKKSPR